VPQKKHKLFIEATKAFNKLGYSNKTISECLNLTEKTVGQWLKKEAKNNLTQENRIKDLEKKVAFLIKELENLKSIKYE
jgi:hypothetical protein